jgi:hypothetical protein
MRTHYEHVWLAGIPIGLVANVTSLARNNGSMGYSFRIWELLNEVSFETTCTS